MRPALYSGGDVSISAAFPDDGNLVDLGNGDFSLALGSENNALVVDASNFTGVLTIVFSSVNGLSAINGSAIAVVDNSSYNIVGNSSSIISMTPKTFSVWSGFDGVCAVIADGLLVARIAISLSEDFSTLFALPLPLFAYREEEAVQPISIANGVAGWEIYSPYQPTRIVGFNLPTSLKYTDDSIEHDFTADGGDYGIEFSTPDRATKITIFNETFWLYMR